jgi:uncharacterized protein YqgC (DUF456 family)
VTRLRDALLLLLALALGLRVAAWLVRPALPLLVVLFVLVAIYSFLFRGRR